MATLSPETEELISNNLQRSVNGTYPAVDPENTCLVHAADGYARSTNTVGVCFTTSGPGATNAITGIATAFMDSSP
ncbi:thiamine pyrophosphate-binding protein, partial [Clostridioides difficile]